MEVVASLSQGRTAAAQCGLFTYKSVPVILEPPCTKREWEFLTEIVLKIKSGIHKLKKKIGAPLKICPPKGGTKQVPSFGITRITNLVARGLRTHGLTCCGM